MSVWPELRVDDWRDTYATLHMWTQVVGKIRLSLTPLVNHWWNVPLYVSTRGLTTSPILYEDRIFEIEFDFIRHFLHIYCSDGSRTDLELRAQSVSAFYRELMEALSDLGIKPKIWTMPVEVPGPASVVTEAIPFDQDEIHHEYDAEYANRFWQALVSIDSVFKQFRSRFIGKVSPVHFFWGSFDLAVTRFSGRRAPLREGADPITAEAYSHEVISHGWWPGGGGMEPMFYAYAAPEPEGLAGADILPVGAYYSAEMKEFFLPYDKVRTAGSPEQQLLSFLQSTYDAAADNAGWNRADLDKI